jgi:hypothetical protein
VLILLYCRYAFVAPDEFMFTEMASLSAIAIIIQRGELTEQQQDWLEHGVPEGTKVHDDAEFSEMSTEMPVTPLCPWFTCCM